MKKRKHIYVFLTVMLCILILGGIGVVTYVRSLPVDWDAGGM